MGQKYVETDQTGVVLHPYDEDNGNVPDGATAITDSEFLILSADPCDYFEIVDGTLQRRAEADDMSKDRIVGGVDDTDFMRAFIRLLIDEINLLRTAANLPPRTLTQFKTAMRNKL